LDRNNLLESQLVDPAVLYLRFQLISKQTWKQIVALGEQTGKLACTEISVVKALEQHFRRKEPVDLKRLEVTAKAIEKLKEFWNQGQKAHAVCN